MAVIKALLKAAYREAQSLNSIQGNNFFWFALLLSMQPESMGFIWTLVGLLMIGPALAAPLAKVPAVRLALWPLGDVARLALRPFTRPEMLPSPWLWRVLPWLEMRQMARTLDFWLALVLAVMGTLYRYLSAQPKPEAYPVLTMLVVLALSTMAQNVFTLDGVGGRLRWKLSPVAGWRVLLRKGVVLITVAMLMTAGLAPVGAMAGMMAALAVGHHFSVFTPVDAGAWRFTMGQFFPFGFLQVIGMFSCGIAAGRGDWFYVGLAAVAWVVSAVTYGWIWERLGLEKV